MGQFHDTFLSRRDLLRLGGVSMAGHYIWPLVKPHQVRAAPASNLRSTARFCIFFMLEGAPSQLDTWDFKEGKWTPEAFDVHTLSSGVKWPHALFPKLEERLDKVSLIRSMEAWEAVHERGCYYMQVAHPLNMALWKELPPVGAVVAAEYAARRKPQDSLPPYVAFNTVLNQASLLGAGMLPATYSPFHMQTDVDLAAFSPPEQERAQFQKRWDFLQKFDSRLRNDSTLAAKAYRDYHNYYEGAVSMMSDPRTAKILAMSEQDRKRYGGTKTGDAAILARNLVTADAGTHFIFLSHEGWDHHSLIYDEKLRTGSLQKRAAELDPALSALIDDLGATKRPDGRTVLDETLIVCTGEFGRTPGNLNENKGRDHYQFAYTTLWAGGGVKGGQIFGKTDETAAKIIDPGWHAKRPVYMEDVATTIYSAMGIDYTKKIETTPSGRAFYYVEPFSQTSFMGNREIRELFG
jgi:Protein of unknown function (DUF1501)